MKIYAIRNIKNGEYFLDVGNQWVKDIEQASKWETAERAQNRISSIKETNLEVVDSRAFALTQEAAEEMFNQIESAAQQMFHLNVLLDYYSKQQSKYDGIQEDILHRIELGNIHGIMGVRLCAKLKQIRIERREVKDKVSFLLMLKSSSVDKLEKAVVSYNFDKNNRTYRKRVQNEKA